LQYKHETLKAIGLSHSAGNSDSAAAGNAPFGPVDSDEAQLLGTKFGFSTSHPK